MKKSSISSTWEEIIYARPSISVWEAEQHLKGGNSLPQHCKPECQHDKGRYALAMELEELAPAEPLGKMLPEYRLWLEIPSADVSVSSCSSSLDHSPHVPPGCIPGGPFLLRAALLASSPAPRTRYASVILIPQQPGATSSHPPALSHF